MKTLYTMQGRKQSCPCAYKGMCNIGGIALLIPNIGILWRWVESFTLRRIYPWEKSTPSYGQ